MEEGTKGVVDALNEIIDEGVIPKNLKEKLLGVKNALSEEDELSLKIDKALHELEEICEDNNLQSFTRTQLWNIASMLEMIK